METANLAQQQTMDETRMQLRRLYLENSVLLGAAHAHAAGLVWYHVSVDDVAWTCLEVWPLDLILTYATSEPCVDPPRAGCLSGLLKAAVWI